MIKIPLWIDVLAYVRPFRFCARCMVCGKKLGGESNES